MNEQSLKELTTRSQLKLVSDLKHSYCAASKNWVAPHFADPWFCVEREKCRSNGTRLEKYDVYKEDTCKTFQHGGKNPICCFIGYIVGMDLGLFIKYGVESQKIDFKDPPRTIGLLFFKEYERNHYIRAVSVAVAEVYKHSHVCSLVPFRYGVDVVDMVHYVPMVCAKKEECNRIKRFFKEDSIFGMAMDEGVGNEFCENTPEASGPVCCHPAAINEGLTVDSNWETPTLAIDQKFANRFKTSFQCEQYSRLVCDGTTDNCAKVTQKSGNSTAGEFPHLALIGIAIPRAQYFYCSGTVVSKYMILSTSFCKWHDDKIASVALTGDFDLWAYNESGSNETLSDIIDVLEPPDSDPEITDLVLFVLRKPLVFGRYLRPACVNTLAPFHKDDTGYDHGTFTGFGTVTTGGRWSQYPKKIGNINIKDLDVSGCQKYNSGHLTHNSSFCFHRTTGGPCEFDLGAPITLEPTNMYCQWILFALATTQITECSSSDHILFKKIESAWRWFEDVLFRDDFDLFEFQVTPPTCHYSDDELSRHRFLHLRKRYSSIYPDGYPIIDIPED
ncbi:hypothetical protein J6590_039036 [Homalodisca vitripennis]|nr:hypothetical protein J6590_039036 [Homalodisca vitripennis]